LAIWSAGLKYDLGTLRRMLPTERQALWQNAKRQIELPEARAIIELIEASGLDYRANNSVRLDDAIGRTLQKIVFSPEGRAAALKATEQGLPALAGVDPLLQDMLGADYGKHNEATVQAGYLVANLMRQAGYDDGPSKPLPSGCVATSGMMFAQKQKKS
jgi:hypothetical protein